MAGLSLTLPVSFSDSSLPKLPVVLTSDSFNRVDGALGSTDAAFGGSRLPWETDINIGVYSNQFRCAGQSTNRTARVDVGRTAVNVQARYLAGAGFGLILGWVDPSNYYHLDVQANGRLGLFRVASGANNPIWGPGAAVASGDTLAVTREKDDTFGVILNGQLQRTLVDASPLLGGTIVGIRSAFTAETRVDDFMVSTA